MTVQQTIEIDYKAAFKTSDRPAVSAFRMLKSSIKNMEIDVGRELTDAETVELIAKEVKKRRDAMQQYLNGGRPELAQREEFDVKLFSKYLPQQLSEQELDAIVTETIAGMGAVGPGEMGKVMGAVMAKVKGRADGGAVQAVVRQQLGQSASPN